MIVGSPPEEQCILWEKGKDDEGYGMAWSKGQSRRASRLAWELFRGPIPKGVFVCHSCDTPPCINIDHLFLGTPADNTHDALAKGRLHGTHHGNGLQGEQHPMSRLTAKEVLAIRKAYRSRKVTLKALGKQYGVYYTTIQKIVNGKIWRTVAQ